MNKPCCYNLPCISALFSRLGCGYPPDGGAGTGEEGGKRFGASGRLNGVWPLIRALLLAPLPLAVFFASFAVLSGDASYAGILGGVTYLYTFGLTLILGVPAFLLLRYLSVNTGCGVALTGALLPLLTFGLIWLLPNEPWTRDTIMIMLLFWGCGAITATAFHFAYAWRRDGDAPDSQSPSAASRESAERSMSQRRERPARHFSSRSVRPFLPPSPRFTARLFASCGRWLRGTGWCLSWLLGVGGHAATGGDQAASYHVLPSDHPYRAVLEHWESGSAERRGALFAWAQAEAAGTRPAPSAPGLSESDRQWLSQLGTALAASAGTRPTATWPLIPDAQDPDDPSKIGSPYLVPVVCLMQTMSAYAGQASPEEGLSVAIGLAHLGRDLASSSTVLNRLVGHAVEEHAAAVVAKRINDFNPDQLQRIGEAWDALPSLPALDETLRGERQFFKTAVDRVYRPGLKAWLDPAPRADGEASPEDSAALDLRLSAMIGSGSERIIGLEDHDQQTSFLLREGETVNGVTLVSIDFARQRASLRVRGREATLDLTSKRIVASPAVGREELVRLLSGVDDPQRRREAEETIARTLDKIRAHPRGLDGYLEDLERAFDQLTADHLLAAETPRLREARPIEIDDPLLQPCRFLFSLFRGVQQSELIGPMVRAGVALRRAEMKGETMEPAIDPWGEPGQRLQWEKTPEGGFLLRSVYEVGPEGGSTFRFGHPKSGWVKP